MALGDVNGDGKPDLALATFNTVSVLQGNGNGAFQPPVLYAAGAFPHWVVLADFNADGSNDLATANGTGKPTPPPPRRWRQPC